jgi:hypothetical protein
MDIGFWQCIGWKPRWDCRFGCRNLIVIPAKAGIQRL